MSENFIHKRIVKACFAALGYVLVAVVMLSLFSAYGRFHYFGKGVDGSKNFEEADYVSSVVRRRADGLIRYIEGYQDLVKMNPEDMGMYIIDYEELEKPLHSRWVYTGADLEEEDGKSIYAIAAEILGDGTYEDGQGRTHDVFEHSYSFYDFVGTTKTFIRISGKDYANLVRLYSNSVDSISDSSYDTEEEHPYVTEVRDQYGNVIYSVVLPNGEYVSGAFSHEYEDENLYGIYEDHSTIENVTEAVADRTDEYSLTIQSMSDSSADINYSEEEGLFLSPSAGIVSIYDIENTNYLYIPYKSVNLDYNVERSLISAPFFTYPAEAFFAALMENELSRFDDYAINSYMMYDTEYCFYNRESDFLVSSMDIDDYNLNITAIANDSDIVMTYNALNRTFDSFYYDKDGVVHGCDYRDERLKNEIEKLGYGTDFVMGMNISRGSDDFTVERALYNYCKAIPQPVPTFIITSLLFVVIMVLLSVSTGVRFRENGEMYIKLKLIDRVPSEVLFITLGAAVIAFYFVIGEGFIRNGYLLRPSGTIDYGSGATTLSLFVLLLAGYVFGMGIYLSFIRRIRAGIFIDKLLLVRLVRWSCKRYMRYTGTKSGKAMFTLKMVCFILINVGLIAFLLYIFVSSGVARDSFNAILIAIVTVIALIDIAGVIKLFRYTRQVEMINDICREIESGNFDAKIQTEYLNGSCRKLGENLNNLGESLSKAVEDSTRDEKLKAELITNVSHDIKTPLTSIINYVDLMKREDVQDPRLKEYIDILDTKSQRLKQLTLDLIEASKVSTGNIELECANIDFKELLVQAVSEYEDKFVENGLELVSSLPAEPAVIYADGRRLFRIIENLFQNAYKYAMTGTRVYLKLVENEDTVSLSIKNVSRDMLNISADELTERFVRGDKSRFTDGSGLGLSIAKNLTELQDGSFDLDIDGDLFKATVTFRRIYVAVENEKLIEEADNELEEKTGEKLEEDSEPAKEDFDEANGMSTEKDTEDKPAVPDEKNPSAAPEGKNISAAPDAKNILTENVPSAIIG